MDEKKKEPFSLKTELVEWLETIVFAAVCVILVFTFVGRMASVNGSSMVPTLHEGDRLITLSLGYTPKYGDIVVVSTPQLQTEPLLVKRIIATEGQTVDIDFAKGQVSVDGVALTEPYINEPTHLEQGLKFPVTVPKGAVFVMGDNRNNSKDSRSPSVGMVDANNLQGRVVFRFFPFDAMGTFAVK